MTKQISPLDYLLNNSAGLSRSSRSYGESALEDRSSQRQSVIIDTYLLGSGGEKHHIIVQNISLSGFVCQTASRFTCGQRYIAEFPELGSRSIDIVWQKGLMTGCCFTDILRQDMLEKLLILYGQSCE